MHKQVIGVNKRETGAPCPELSNIKYKLNILNIYIYIILSCSTIVLHM